MFLVCPGCGGLAVDRAVRKTAPGRAEAVCPTCGRAQPLRFRPLPVVVGASGSGKSTLAARLVRSPGDLFVFENDVLWGPGFDTPEDGYAAFRTALLRIALNVNQSRVTTVLFTSALPADLEAHPLARYFDGLSFLVLTCPDEVLAARLRARPAWRASGDDAFLGAMQTFNAHLGRVRGHHITHLDTGRVSLDEAETRVRRWLGEVLGS